MTARKRFYLLFATFYSFLELNFAALFSHYGLGNYLIFFSNPKFDSKPVGFPIICSYKASYYSHASKMQIFAGKMMNLRNRYLYAISST